MIVTDLYDVWNFLNSNSLREFIGIISGLGNHALYQANKMLSNMGASALFGEGTDIKAAALNAAVSALAAYGANNIGNAYREGKIDTILHKIAHAGLGGAVGGVLGGTSGAITGGASAALAELLVETGFDKQKEANAIVRENPHLSTQEKQTLFIKKFKDHAELIKFGTALGALAMGRDVNLAHKIASNALDHNAIPIDLGKRYVQPWRPSVKNVEVKKILGKWRKTS